MRTPEVSLIITVKDQAAFLRDALSSSTTQFDDLSQMEVIVVDDGSEDAPEAVVSEFIPRLPRLEFLRHATVKGVSAARQTGLAHATGKTLALLDGDDWLAPGHLASMLSSLDRLDVDFIKCDVIPETNGNRKVRRAPQARRNVALDPRESILPVNTSTMIDYPFVWAAAYKRELWDNGILSFDTNLRTAEDRVATWRLHLNTKSFAVVDAPGILYRRGVTTSLTSVGDDRQLDFGPGYERIITMVLEDHDAEMFLPKALRQFLAIAHHHVARKHLLDPTTRAVIDGVIRKTAAAAPPQDVYQAWSQLDHARRKRLRAALTPVMDRTARAEVSA